MLILYDPIRQNDDCYQQLSSAKRYATLLTAASIGVGV